MNKILVTLSLLAMTLGSSAQEHALAKYKGYHQLTWFDSVSVVMEESGLSHVDEHLRINMIDRTGCNNNATYKIDYDPQSAYVEIRQVLVHRMATNTVDTIVSPSFGKVYDYVAPARLIYWGASQKMAEIGHLEPGDEIEVWTYRKGFTYALLRDDDSRYIPPMRGHFYDIVPFWSEQPIKKKVYQISVLTNKNLRYNVYNRPETVQIDSMPSGNRTVYSFTCDDILPIQHEPNALADNDIQCKLILTTAPNWQSKSIWFYGVNEDYGSFKTTPEVTKKVKELLTNAHNELDSISILTHWVADNIRYCGISMGEGEGYTLHNAQMNFTDRCGVCKDKAGMLVTMLRAAGFKSYAAMTMAHERIEDIPADQFNHSVCVVQRRNGEYQLLDPTWVPNVRELWSSAEQQQGYLMGLPNGARMMYTPTSPAENHYLRITGKSKIKHNGTLEGTLVITAEGQSDASVRRIFNARMSEWTANLEKELLKIDPRAQIEEVSYSDNDHYLDHPVTIFYHYVIPDYAIITKDAIIFIPFTARNIFSRAQSHLSMNIDANDRSQDFSIGCSQLVEIKEEITLPSKYARMVFEKEISGVTHPAVNYGCGFELYGKTLRFAENLMLNKRVYDAADYPAFRTAVLNQKTMATTPVILKKK